MAIASVRAPAQCPANISLKVGECLKNWPVIKDVYATSAEDCCARCGQDESCSAFTFNSIQEPPCHLRPFSNISQAANISQATKNAAPSQGKTCTSGVMHPPPPPPPPSVPCVGKCPNLVYILNDDTDYLLGSTAALGQTRELLGAQGATFTEFRTLSPKCTPSRTGQLVGRHYHNVRPTAASVDESPAQRTAPPGGGLDQDTMFEPTALFPMLVAHGYWTSIVGKVHNGQKKWLCSANNQTEPFTHVGTLCSPCGNYWGAEYVVKDPGDATTRLEKLANATDWSTYSHAQFGNRSTAFMRKAVASHKPFFAHIGTTGPHLPSIPAPWHLPEVASWRLQAPRTPNFNEHAASHHPTIAALPPIDDDKVHFVDQHMRDRVGTLLSIDDLVAGVVACLEELNVLKNSYIMYSSDHGYHIGQWRLPLEKMWPYETDTRIPFWIRGPGIAPGTELDVLGVNMDIAPTLLQVRSLHSV